MSSILKALKKLEEEKAAKQGQRVDITKDIFGAAQQPATGIRWPLIAAGAAGAVALGVVAYLFIAKPGTRPTPPPVPAETRLSAAVPSPAPAVEPLTAVPQPPQETRPVAPKPAPPRVVPPAAPKAVAAKPKAPGPCDDQTGKGYRDTKGPCALPRFRPSPPTTRSSAPRLTPAAGKTGGSRRHGPVSAPAAAATPKITVSGIAYNKDAADRLAVINGVPVGEGKSVSGVKVEEIMPDKVRFSSGQKSFEVPVGRSNQ